MAQLTISTRALLAAATCISTDQTRYYLRGVAVQPHPRGGALLISTDGHRMMVVHDEWGSAPRDMILSLNWKAKELKSSPREEGERCLVLEVPDDARLLPSGTVAKIQSPCMRGASRYLSGAVVGAMTVDEVDGTFPAWDRVVPFRALSIDTMPKAQLAFDPRYIASFLTAFAYLDDSDDGKTLTMTATDPGEPLLLRSPTVANAFGILMPKRPGPYPAMDWMAHKAPPPPKEQTDAAA